MGWANDGNIIRRAQGFTSYSGEIFVYEGQRTKRRTAPGVWTDVVIFTNGGPQYAGAVKIWNGRLWATAGPPTDRRVCYSEDGINWIVDFALTTTWGTQDWGSSFGGGEGEYLYLAHFSLGWTQFARRSKTGVWTNNVIPAVFGLTLVTYDIVGYDNSVFWARFPYGTSRWTGSAWVDADPAEPAVYQWQFLVRGGLLFGVNKRDATYEVLVWRWTGDNWALDGVLTPTGSGSQRCCLSVGDDSNLYIGSGTSDGHIWRRMPGANWTLVGKDINGRGSSSAILFGTDFYHGEYVEPAPQVRLFAPDFNVSVSGLYPQAMDVDGDGNALYIGLIDNATTFPVLVKVALPLEPTLMGAEVYTGTAGTAINVECPNVGQRAVIAGNFGMNEQVEVSEDGGATWVDIDRDAWGAETAQPVLVDPDTVDEVMVALQTAQTITETDDGGTTAWTVNNAAVGYGVQAMARLSADSDELVIGDAHAARKVEYSPNRGVTLADITGGVAIGDVVALEVV